MDITNQSSKEGIRIVLELKKGADTEQLTALPGIGEVLAQRIIAYREENGSFLSTDELKNVEGIGEKRLEAILDLITVGG